MENLFLEIVHYDIEMLTTPNEKKNRSGERMLSYHHLSKRKLCIQCSKYGTR